MAETQSPPPETAPAAPAPTTTTVATAPDTTQPVMDKFDSAFEDLPKPEPKPAAKSEVDTTPEPPKKDDVKPEAKPSTEKPSEGATVEKDDLPNFKTNKEMREFAYSRHKEAKQLKKDIEELNKKLSSVQSADPKTKGELEALLKKVNSLEKQHEEKEQRIRVLDYRQSDDYKTKFEQPIATATQEATERVTELFVREKDPSGELGEDGQPKTIKRQGTRADLEALYVMPLGQRTEEAERMFGRAASIVLADIESIKSLTKKAGAEIKTYQSQADKLREEEAAKTVQERERQSAEQRNVEELWVKTNEALSSDERGKEYWGEDKDDKEANAELAKGFAFVDRRFNGEYKAMPVQEKVLLDAAIRHRVAGFYKLSYLNRKLKDELATVKKDNEQLRGSEPGKPSTTGTEQAAPKPKTAMEALEELPS